MAMAALEAESSTTTRAAHKLRSNPFFRIYDHVSCTREQAAHGSCRVPGRRYGIMMRAREKSAERVCLALWRVL